MNMTIISLAGILLGVVLFIFMSVKGFQLVISACSASLIIILTSGQPIMDMITVTWMTGFSNFLRSFFLVLTLSAVIGKLMNDAGAAKRIAKSLYHICKRSKGNQKFVAALFVPLMYLILTYAGISGLVVVFTVLGIGKQIMQEFDIPWRLYCYGGATSICTMWIPGSLNLTNIAASAAADTSLAGGALIGVIAAVVYLIVAMLFLFFDLRRAEKKGEGFMESGAAFLESSPAPSGGKEQEMPPLPLAIFPLLATIVMAALFGIDILIALFVGVVLAILCFWKYIPSMKKTLGEGVGSAFGPVVGVGATSAVASVIMAAPGFAMMVGLLSSLPSVLEGVGYITIITFIMGSPTGAVSAMGARTMECFAAAGLPAGASGRLIALSAFTSCPPHSPAIANVTAVARLDYRRAVKIYLKVGLIGGLCALMSSILLIMMGITV